MYDVPNCIEQKESPVLSPVDGRNFVDYEHKDLLRSRRGFVILAGWRIRIRSCHGLVSRVVRVLRLARFHTWDLRAGALLTSLSLPFTLTLSTLSPTLALAVLLSVCPTVGVTISISISTISSSLLTAG